jgi:hypothetical protein
LKVHRGILRGVLSQVSSLKSTHGQHQTPRYLAKDFLALYNAAAPPEIRCQVYRILLATDRNVRMKPAPDDNHHIPRPNNLFPAILGTCRLIYNEARHVLYGENLFLAHRMDLENHNLVFIQRARYDIGRYGREDGEAAARNLARFLDDMPSLKYIEVVFHMDLFEDPSIHGMVDQAILKHGSLTSIHALCGTCIEFGNC